MSIGLRIPYNSNFTNDTIHFQFYDKKTLSDQIGKPLLNEMSITKLENLFHSFDLCLSRRSWHIMCTTHGRGRQMIERSTVSHLSLKFLREPPKEEARPPMPVPVRARTGSENTVFDCCPIMWITSSPIPPSHGLLTKVVRPPMNREPPQYNSCMGLLLCF